MIAMSGYFMEKVKKFTDLGTTATARLPID